MADRKPKRPRDVNELGVTIGKLATGEMEETEEEDTRDPAAVALGRKGGLKGGKARAQRLSAEERTEISKRAAAARWATRADSPDITSR